MGGGLDGYFVPINLIIIINGLRRYQLRSTDIQGFHVRY